MTEVGRNGPELFVPDRPGTIVPNNALGRSRFLPELADLRVRDRLIAYTNAEVGGQGPAARQAFMETILNRAVARDQPLAKTLSGSYFPGVTHSRAARGVSEAQRAEYGPLVQEVLGGSNLANYATGNASGTVGFAGGPQTYAAGGERFGIEGPDKGWWTRVGAAGPTAGGGVGYTAPPQRGVGQIGQTLADLQPTGQPRRARADDEPLFNLVDYAALAAARGG